MRAIDLQDRGPRQVSPLELGLIELPSRPRSEYTAAIRHQAIQAADGGSLGPAADLTRAAMTEDGYARGVLGSLVYGLWGLPMNFIGDPTMIAALTDSPKGAGEWRTMFPQPEAIRLMSWGATLGVGIGQMRRRYSEPGEDVVSIDEAADGSYKVRRPLRPIGANNTRVLRTWDPKNLRHEWDRDTWWLNTADGEIRITPNDGEWILYTPYGEVKPWEFGAWKALTLAFVLGRDALFDQSRHAEKLAPMRVGKVPGGTTEKQRRLYLRQIKEMQRFGAFVLPPGLEYSIVEGTGRISDIYEKIIAWQQRSYCLIFTGNETTTTGSKGFSAGDVQERIAKTTLKSFAGSFASCLHDGGLVDWSVANYGTNDPPLAFFDCDPPEDKLARAKTVDAAGASLVSLSAGLEKVGLRLTVESATAYAQGFGFAVEAIPVALAAKVATKLDIAPTDIAKVFTADEIRASQGAGPFGDPRGAMTIPEIDAAAAAPKAPPGAPALPPGPPAPTQGAPATPVLVASEDDVPPTDESAAVLAAKMTEHAVPKCEHGSSNRCLKCGIVRTRDFDHVNGAPVWRVGWKSIAPPAAPAVEASPDPVPAPAALVASREATPLEAAEALLVAALATLDALGEEPDDDEIETLAHGYNPDQERANDGKFGSGAGGSGHVGPRDPRVASQGTKDGLGRSKAAGVARKNSSAAQGATDAAKAGGSHADAHKAHADAAAQHHEAAKRSIREDYKEAHRQAAAAHEAVANAHADEHAKSEAAKAAAKPSPEKDAAKAASADAHEKTRLAQQQVGHAEAGDRKGKDGPERHAIAADKYKAAAHAHEAASRAAKAAGDHKGAASHDAAAKDAHAASANERTAMAPKAAPAGEAKAKAAGKAAHALGGGLPRSAPGDRSDLAGKASAQAHDPASHEAAAKLHDTAANIHADNAAGTRDAADKKAYRASAKAHKAAADAHRSTAKEST